MKKIYIFFLFIALFLGVIVYTKASPINVAVVAPFEGSLSRFSNDLYNGLELSLPEYVNLVKVDVNSDVLSSLKSISPLVIVGPFAASNVRIILSKYCNRSVLIVLPFAKQKNNCSNVIYYGYDPLSAARQMAEYICRNDITNIGILYSFDKVDLAQKNLFDSVVEACGIKPSIEDGIPSIYTLMDDFVKELFGVVKIKNFSGLTEGKVFEHSLNLNALVVFAPQDVLIHLLSLLDYYDIGVNHIFSTNVQINSNILSLGVSIKRSLKFITPYFMCQNTHMGEKFLEEYRDNFYSNPDFVSALGYDIGYILNHFFRGFNILDIKNKDLLLGHLLFFDDNGSAIVNYRMIGYRGLQKCGQEILNK